jgi:hypothetical protein
MTTTLTQYWTWGHAVTRLLYSVLFCLLTFLTRFNTVNKIELQGPIESQFALVAMVGKNILSLYTSKSKQDDVTIEIISIAPRRLQEHITSLHHPRLSSADL